MWVVDLSRVEDKLWKLPKPIFTRFHRWVDQINEAGMPIVRKIPGLHDEPLKGRRSGQRSVRLNRSWRVIYQEFPSGEITIIEIQEITKHEY